MATERHGQIIETPTEARQAEPGPSVLALLTASTGLAILILASSGSCSSACKEAWFAAGAAGHAQWSAARDIFSLYPSSLVLLILAMVCARCASRSMILSRRLRSCSATSDIREVDLQIMRASVIPARR